MQITGVNEIRFHPIQIESNLQLVRFTKIPYSANGELEGEELEEPRRDVGPFPGAGASASSRGTASR